MCKQTMQMMSHQIRHVNKEIGIMKRKQGFCSWKFSRGVKHQIWIERRRTSAFEKGKLKLFSLRNKTNDEEKINKALEEKAMASHSNTLTWKIPWAEEPGRLQSMGSLRVRHDWATSLSLFTFMHWRRKWQPTPVFLPGESLGWWSLVGCHLWGHTESDTSEAT